MEKLAIISIAFLIIVPQFNSSIPSLDTSKAETLVSGYFITQDQQFPDRSKEAGIAKQIDAQREQARLEALRQAEAQKQAQVPQPAQKATLAPSIMPTGSCKDWIIQAGVSDVENAYYLIMKESGCNPNAVNKSSGACGIPQALPCSKLGTSDPVAQIRWMQSYCISRYGSWAGAVAHSKSVGWY